MSLPAEDFATRRAELAVEIARQRGQLAAAYRDLEKPIRYAEYGMKGIGFLRSNPWIFVAVPGIFSIASTLLGLRKTKATKPAPTQSQSAEKKPKGLKDNLVVIGGHALKLYQLYRRVRPLFL